MRNKLNVILTMLLLIAGLQSEAQYLSEAGLFQRCYLQITNTRPKSTDPLTIAVKAGTKTAVNACLEVLQKGNLSASGETTLANTADPVSKNVLLTFHRLHSSWFFAKDFPTISAQGMNMDTKDLYDSSSPALYFTRALFQPSGKLSDAITTNDNLIPIRTNMDPSAGPSTSHAKTDFIFTSPFVFAATGDLLGIKPSGSLPIAAIASVTSIKSFDLYFTLGGGLLGSEPYLLENLSPLPVNAVYKTDGANKVHRHWGKSVFHDLLCRELPVVRESDVTGMVSATSPITFRTSTSCTKCHASHDRIAGVVRGMKVNYFGKGDPSVAGLVNRGGNFVDLHPVTKPAETSWGFTEDVDYYQRPSNGVLYFRDYTGSLINQKVTSVSDLGSKIANMDDYYLCAAKRYYSYFTGIKVDLGDLSDPDHPALSSSDLKHRTIVINLGKHLKQTQSLQTLVSDILQLDHYRKIDFGTRSGVNVP